MPLKSAIYGAHFVMLLAMLLGCGASPLGEQAPATHDGRERNLPPVVRAEDLRSAAPISVSLTGPDAPQDGETLTLNARIACRKPIQVPVAVELVLPEGVELLEGERLITLPANTQAHTHHLSYVIRAKLMPAADVKLVVHARGPGFGYHTEQPYRFGRSAPLAPLAPAKDGAPLRVGDKTFGRSVDITPR